MPSDHSANASLRAIPRLYQSFLDINRLLSYEGISKRCYLFVARNEENRQAFAPRRTLCKQSVRIEPLILSLRVMIFHQNDPACGRGMKVPQVGLLLGGKLEIFHQLETCRI